MLHHLEFARLARDSVRGLHRRSTSRSGVAEVPQAEVVKEFLMPNMDLFQKLGCLAAGMAGEA